MIDDAGVMTHARLTAAWPDVARGFQAAACHGELRRAGCLFDLAKSSRTTWLYECDSCRSVVEVEMDRGRVVRVETTRPDDVIYGRN